MPGNTATIDVCQFRADWMSHAPMRALCDRYGITRDQVIRLKVVWSLPPRHDRKLRFKPKRQKDPSPSAIAKACRLIQEQWDEATRVARSVEKPQPYTPPMVIVDPNLQALADECSQDGEW